MSKITDYGFLFQQMLGTKNAKNASVIGSFQLSQLNSSSVQAQLRAAGIDTNSAQYKAAIKEMTQNGNGAMFTNIQCIKNSMKCYDKDGDYINPRNGLAGLVLTDENAGRQKRMDVYDNLYRKTKKDDRLAAGYTMEQYERAYRQTFISAVKQADSNWEIGKPIPSGALNGITRESVEANLKKSGSLLTQASVDTRI